MPAQTLRGPFRRTVTDTVSGTEQSPPPSTLPYLPCSGAESSIPAGDWLHAWLSLSLHLLWCVSFFVHNSLREHTMPHVSHTTIMLNMHERKPSSTLFPFAARNSRLAERSEFLTPRRIPIRVHRARSKTYQFQRDFKSDSAPRPDVARVYRLSL